MKISKEVETVAASKPYKIEWTTYINDDESDEDEFLTEVLSMKPKEARIEKIAKGYLTIEIRETK